MLAEIVRHEERQKVMKKRRDEIDIQMKATTDEIEQERLKTQKLFDEGPQNVQKEMKMVIDGVMKRFQQMLGSMVLTLQLMIENMDYMKEMTNQQEEMLTKNGEDTKDQEAEKQKLRIDVRTEMLKIESMKEWMTNLNDKINRTQRENAAMTVKMEKVVDLIAGSIKDIKHTMLQMKNEIEQMADLMHSDKNDMDYLRQSVHEGVSGATPKRKLLDDADAAQMGRRMYDLVVIVFPLICAVVLGQYLLASV